MTTIAIIEFAAIILLVWHTVNPEGFWHWVNKARFWDKSK